MWRVALIRVAQAISMLQGSNEDQNMDIKVVLRIMEAPLRQIVMNSSKEASIIANNIKHSKKLWL